MAYEQIEQENLEAQEPTFVTVEAVAIGELPIIVIDEITALNVPDAFRLNTRLTVIASDVNSRASKLIAKLRALISSFGLNKNRTARTTEIITALMKPLKIAEKEFEVAFKCVRNTLRINGRWNHQAVLNLLENSAKNLQSAEDDLKVALLLCQETREGRRTVYWCEEMYKKGLAGDERI